MMMPIPGSGEVVRITAGRLTAIGAHLDDVAGRLAVVRATGVWESPSGTQFSERVGCLPETLRAVARRYAGAGRSVASFASRLEDAQAMATAAIREHDDAVADRDRWDARIDAELARREPDTSWLVLLRRWRLEAAERVLLTERRHAQAWHDVRTADWLCASGLDTTAAVDGGGDTAAYRALNVGAEVASDLNTWLGAAGFATRGLGPVGVALSLASVAAGAAQVGLESAVKVGYGDGDWGTIGVNAAWTVAGATGLSMARGSQASMRVARHGASGPASVWDRWGTGIARTWADPLGVAGTGGAQAVSSAGVNAAVHPGLRAGVGRFLQVDEYRIAARQGAVATDLKATSDVLDYASAAMNARQIAGRTGSRRDDRVGRTTTTRR